MRHDALFHMRDDEALLERSFAFMLAQIATRLLVCALV